jgi:hypothetical protein
VQEKKEDTVVSKSSAEAVKWCLAGSAVPFPVITNAVRVASSKRIPKPTKPQVNERMQKETETLKRPFR